MLGFFVIGKQSIVKLYKRINVQQQLLLLFLVPRGSQAVNPV